MRPRLLSRVSIAAILGTSVFCGASSAAADGAGTVPVPTTADRVASAHVCELSGGPYRNEDVWAFAAAAGNPVDGLAAMFIDASGAIQRRSTAAADQAVDLDGRSVAWLRVPVGWVLVGAEARSGRPPSTGTGSPPSTGTGSPPSTGTGSPSSTGTGSPSSGGTRIQRQRPSAISGETVVDAPASPKGGGATDPTPGDAGSGASTVEPPPGPTRPGPEPGQTPGAGGKGQVVLLGACGAATAGLALAPAATAHSQAPTVADTRAARQATGAAQQGADGTTTRALATLPTTGEDIGSMLAVGRALVLAGVLLLIVRRRRVPRHLTRSDDGTGLVWIAPSNKRLD